MLIRTLTLPECTKLLQDNRVGRLACSKDGRPYVVPIYYAYSDNHLFAFSMPGKKIDYMRANPQVSLLVEQRQTGREWTSVIADGGFEELSDRVGFKRQREHAWSLLSKNAAWWEPGALKPVAHPISEDSPYVFFRLVIEELSGREAKDE